MIARHGKYFLKYYPQHMILLSLIISTCIGTLLLSLKACRLQDIAWIDLFFTATSLTTVTGFTSIPLEQFSDFGHIIVLCLMQLGGLGVMTLSLSFVYMFSNLGIYTQVLASDILSLKSFKDTKQTLFFIIKLTAITEILGSLIILPTMLQTYSFKKAIFMSLFHSVSSFCNAGFTLFPNKLISYQNNYIMLTITMMLMIIGGLGFVTWQELSKKFLGTEIKFISWHTKLVLRFYLITALGSAIIFWLLERTNTLADMSFFKQIYISLFMGVSMKSTGFILVSFASVQIATLLIAMICMFIGSAPLSTGSGIKTSVFAIYLAIIHAAIQGKRHAMLYERHIVDDQVYKAMAIISLSFSWITCIVFGLLVVQPDWQFIDVVFTTFAAFSNNGITLKDPATLNGYAKVLLMFSMLIGRIGSLAIILSIKRISELRDLVYPKEHVILG